MLHAVLFRACLMDRLQMAGESSADEAAYGADHVIFVHKIVSMRPLRSDDLSNWRLRDFNCRLGSHLQGLGDISDKGCYLSDLDRVPR
jgi:hypothetical protein